MPFYSYRAVDADGKAVTGSLYARDIPDVKRRVQENGLLAIKIMQGTSLSDKFKKLTTVKVKIKDVTLFCRQLYIIISSGVNILNGLDILRKQTQNKVMRNVVGKIYGEVQKGYSLSEAMAGVETMLPKLLVNMVSVGEVSGNLDEILNRMSTYYEKDNYMREKLKGAMTYPVILLVAGLGMLIFFMNVVMPEIISVVSDMGGDLPLITRLVIGGVEGFRKFYLLVLGGLAGVVILLKTLVPKEVFRYVRDRLLMKLPIISQSIKNIVTSRFLRTTSMMLKGGIPIIYVLESIESVLGNAIAEKGIRAALEGVKRGERLGANIASCNFFDSIVTHMIDIGEETGELDNILESMADFYDKEAETWLMKMMAAIEPVFTIVIGIFIAVLIIAMMIPMFSMMSSMGQ